MTALSAVLLVIGLVSMVAASILGTVLQGHVCYRRRWRSHSSEEQGGLEASDPDWRDW